MATSYTVSSGDRIRPYRNCQLRYFREAASQSFVIGELLILQTSADKGNQVKISGSDPASGTVVGVAAEAATGTENSLIGVFVLDERAEFILPVVDAQALDADDIGDEYGVAKDVTNVIWRLDRTETTAKVFRVIDFAPGYGHGDTNGKFIVKSAIGVQAVFGS